MKRSRLKTKPRDRGTDQDAAFAWFQAVTRRARCVVCGKQHPQMQGHHVVPQQVLRTEFPYGAVFITGSWLPVDRRDAPDELAPYPFRSLQQLLWDARNGIPLCPDDHERHTTMSRLVPITAIPMSVITFARELGLEHRLGPRFYDHTGVQ